ncbi:UvrD-helicase domain-containing protein [Martelella mediterranea]|uniref:UvrD/REP helicase N-terminal domain-containing protein n=1 Tax=Martelella mediterranea TaxID=293089 RepID=A0A4R3NU43_9HYPH|nr:UvrD-helicase domain-containing protein [Martelella mediterranea]TCT39592.1 UvrD/REP helicase N-terminal domain-containing protein [Martelella mediterranea]
MKYICIDDGALTELISGREYQSIDFEEGDRLVKSLFGYVSFVAKMRKITLFQDSEGAFLTTPGPWKRKKYLVIDCEMSALFTQLRSGESLQSFQKLLRFCAKYWSGGVLNNSEKIVSGSSKAIIFPLAYSTRPYRIAIERAPMADRLKRRDMDGHFLLVYKTGWEGANSSTETPDEANFRRVFDRLQEIYSVTSKAHAQVDKVSGHEQIAVTNLDQDIKPVHSLHNPFDDWVPRLTARQKKFVFANANTPHRLLGPAGTGKTLSLLLRTIRVLGQAEHDGDTCKALLVTHSEATRQSIKDALRVIDPSAYQDRDPRIEPVSLSVETLASLCASILKQSISESEFVDRDAQDSKLLQQMYIEQAIERVHTDDFHSFKPHLSPKMKAIWEAKGNSELAVLFQHEISVLIKGRAGDSFDVYKNCPSLKYGLPISGDADKGLSFQVFKRYQEQLEASSQFDTDDVVISAAGQLDTPIWRRRRAREAYDFIAIDETHLFNINELHIFHHFTRHADSLPISFTVDHAQAVGDRGWNDVDSFAELFGDGSQLEEEQTAVSAVFRSSPQIRDFCQSVLASGATLFTNFDDTLAATTSAFTSEEERRAQPVRFIEYADDARLVMGAFQKAEELQSETGSSRSQVLITTLDDDLLKLLQEYSSNHNKPTTFLKRRGDFTTVATAEKSGHIVLGHADFVGGLEFDVVVIVGVDKGRVPQNGETEVSNSRSFASYAAHNRLYVAASRARFALNLLGVQSRGPSDLLGVAIKNKLIEGIT